MSNKDEKIMEKIYKIIREGNNVEIRGTANGELKILEVKKKIISVWIGRSEGLSGVSICVAVATYVLTLFVWQKQRKP